MNWLGLVALASGIALTVYLVVALVRAERF